MNQPPVTNIFNQAVRAITPWTVLFSGTTGLLLGFIVGKTFL